MTTTPMIVAIGGGQLGPAGTEPIDRHIVALTGSDHPKATFIPTASQDDEDYAERFKTAYAALGVTTTVLTLTKRDYTRTALADIITASDIIYVGGGNTLLLYNYLVANGLDALLRAAWERGTILCGLSAGCLIWHERGLSDSIAAQWTPVMGLGFVPGFVTPHYDSESERQPAFRDVIQRRGYVGLALEDGTAAIYHAGDLAEIVSVSGDHNAYRVERSADGTITTTPLSARLLSS